MRKTKDYLPKLLEYIDLANKIPSDFIFPVISQVFNLTIERLKKKERRCSPRELIETYQILLKDFPSDLCHYVFNTDEVDVLQKFKLINKKVDLLASLNQGLGTLAYAVTQELFAAKPINETIEGIEQFFPEYSAILTASIAVNTNGEIELKTTKFFDFITNHKIEARRIRSCVICEKIFWAKRFDSFSCSKKCGNTWRQKIWQLENRDEYNEKRRNNYAYKQKIKTKKEKKKNGTL